MSQGFLISIEGIDGSGKTTLAKNLSDTLQNEGYQVVLTKEPGQTSLGEKLKTILHEEKGIVSDKAEFLLFAANRAQHFTEIIIPNLKAGKIIISDRMADSSLAYQGYGRQLDPKTIATINQWAMENITPHLTFYLKIDPKMALKRIVQRQKKLTSFEQEEIDFWKRVINGYETIFANRTNVIFLDGMEKPATLTVQAFDVVREKMKQQGT